MILNPFVPIEPVRLEKSDKRIKRIAKKINAIYKKSKHGLVILIGERGYGGTHMIHEFLGNKKHSYVIMNDNLAVEMPKSRIVVIDDFENLLAMNKSIKKAVVENIVNASKKQFIITKIDEKKFNLLLKELPKLKNAKKIVIPPMSFEEAKEMIIQRLNLTREKPSRSLKPFTEKELKHIWKKANGNPRIILMICSIIYNERVAR